jgi:signal transduction histidine kinase
MAPAEVTPTDPLVGNGGGAGKGEATTEIVGSLVQASAWRSERTLAVGRAVFSCVLLVRTLLVTAPSFERMATGLPAILATVAFSLLVLSRGEKYRTRPGFLLLSVAFDASACFLILLPMALWPELRQVPLLDKADISGLLLVVASSAFRHSVRASLLSCLLNISSFLLLMHWDRAAPWTFVERHVALLYLLFLLAMGVVAALLARRTRELAANSARAALEADRVQKNLALILRDHHDLRSQLASATLNTDLAQRELAGMRSRPLRLFIDRARLSLAQINTAVNAIKERSYESLAELDQPRPADLPAAASAVGQELARRFPAARLELRIASNASEPWVAGGSDGLRRLLLNLVTNSCEGSGERGASTILIEGLNTPEGHTSIVVCDDGPGFTTPFLAAQGRLRLSSKVNGFGLGLSLVRRIAEASAGKVVFHNDCRGGARVEVILPARQRAEGTA